MSKDRKKNLALGLGAGLAISAGAGYLAYRKYAKLRDSSDFLFIADNKTVDFSEEVFEDVSVVALASNILVDLSAAQADENPMTLFVKGAGSNLDVVLPEGWNVKTEGLAVGSHVDDVTDFDYEDIQAPLLFVDYDLKGSTLNIFYAFDHEELEEALEEAVEEVIEEIEEVLEEVEEETEEE